MAHITFYKLELIKVVSMFFSIILIKLLLKGDARSLGSLLVNGHLTSQIDRFPKGPCRYMVHTWA